MGPGFDRLHHNFHRCQIVRVGSTIDPDGRLDKTRPLKAKGERFRTFAQNDRKMEAARAIAEDAGLPRQDRQHGHALERFADRRHDTPGRKQVGGCRNDEVCVVDTGTGRCARRLVFAAIAAANGVLAFR